MQIGKGVGAGEQSLPRATAFCRSARTAATFFWIAPDCSAAQAPPAFSMSWNIDQAAAQSSSVSASIAPEPAAGSATRARFDSSRSTSCVLRAARRANASGRPSGAVCGSTVIASAPPKPAAATAIGGAEHVHVRIAPRHHPPRRLGGEMTGFGVSPQAASTRAQSFRTARNLAMVRN